MKLNIILLGASALMASGALAQETLAPTEKVAEAAAEAAETATDVSAEAAAAAAIPVEEAMSTAILQSGASVLFSMDKALATDKREKIKGQPKPPKGKRRITNMGDAFTMTVAEDVVRDSTVVIPKGTRGFGEVTMVTGRGGFGKSGKIEFKLNYLELDGKQVAMEGTHLQKGKGRGGAAIAGAVVAGAVVGFLIKGSEADVPLLSEWNFTTVDDIEYKVSGNAPAAEEVAEAAADAVEAPAPVSAEDSMEDAI